MKEFLIKIKTGTDKDLTIGSFSGLTWGESLDEEGNDRKTLTFNVFAEETDLLKYIRVGRTVRLETRGSKDKNMDFIISGIAPIEGEYERDYFEVTAEDYASFVFTRNNVGLNLNTMEDEDYFRWLDENGLVGTVQDLMKYILIRGRLFNEEEDDGWKIVYGPSLDYTIKNGVWLFSIEGDTEIIHRAIEEGKSVEIQALVYNRRGKGKGPSRAKTFGRRISATREINEVPGWFRVDRMDDYGDFKDMDLTNYGQEFITALNYKNWADQEKPSNLYSKNKSKDGYYFYEVAFLIQIGGEIFLSSQTKFTKFLYYGEGAEDDFDWSQATLDKKRRISLYPNEKE